jgi:hypothetical protein
LKNLADQLEINEVWKNIKAAIIESAKIKIPNTRSLQRMNAGMKNVDKPLNKIIQQQ